jgi:hypothetical protein
VLQLLLRPVELELEEAHVGVDDEPLGLEVGDDLHRHGLAGAGGQGDALLGDFQRALAKLMVAAGTFSLVTDSGKAASNGGGMFEPDGHGGGTIYLETSMLNNRTGDVMGTPETAFAHETGHSLKELSPAFFEATNSRFVGSLAQGYFVLAIRGEGYAVNFEDRYRQSRNLPIRHLYSDTQPPIRVDFDIPLFP